MSQGTAVPAAQAALEQSGRAALRFEVRVVHSGRQVLARVEGPLDVEHTPEFVARIAPLCRPAHRVVVDLRGTDYIDSAGVRALLKLQGELRMMQGEVLLVADPESRAARTLRLLRLDTQFPMFHRAADAWHGEHPAAAAS